MYLLRLSLLGLGLALFSCSKSKEGEGKVNDTYVITNPLVIDTTYIQDFVADINCVKNIEIRARVKGYLERIYIDEGKPVAAGQVMFLISSQEYKQDLLKANAKLKNSIAEAKAAELMVQNTKLLVDKSVVSVTELEMAQAKLDALNSMIDEAKSEVETAKLKLSYTEIRAPFSGVIDRIPNKVGSLIDEGTLMTTLSDNSEVYVYFNVSEKEYLEFFKQKIDNESGKKSVTLALANGDIHPYKGHVETIEGEFNNETGSIAFRARFPNPKGILKQGSSGKIRYERKVSKAMLIPQKSTFEVQDKSYVYVVDAQNQVKAKSFVPLMRIPHLFIVESGIEAGDKIIYEGIQNVKEGQTVKTQTESLQKIVKELGNQ
jgi:RND family efflux transporter MFP subunit